MDEQRRDYLADALGGLIGLTDGTGRQRAVRLDKIVDPSRGCGSKHERHSELRSAMTAALALADLIAASTPSTVVPSE
jgi:hypothetical protein